ncbi:MAG: ABC transporter permease [Zavarzinia sp.]|nr:ABC transporter permease [Zavarzinia sp.]
MGKRNVSYLLVLPAVLLIGGFLYSHVLLLGQSLFVDGEFSLDHYMAVVSDSYYLGIFGDTFRITAISAIIVVAWGFPLAFWMVRTNNKRLQAFLIIVTAVPLLLTHVIKLYALVLLLGNTGVINEFLRAIGLIGPNESVRMMRNEFAVVVGLVTFALPFGVFTMASSIKRFDSGIEEAAMILGANRVRTFVEVTLPLVTPGLFSALTLSFVLASTALSTPLILGGGGVQMIANQIYDQAVIAFDFPKAATLAVTGLVAMTVILRTVAFVEKRFLFDGQ